MEIIAACWIRFFFLLKLFRHHGQIQPKVNPRIRHSPTGPSVVKWFEKAERVCWLCKIKEPMLLIPLRLTKGAYAVYQQLGDDAGLEAGTVCGFWCRPLRRLEMVYRATA